MREFSKACNVYCCPQTNQVVVAAVYNHGGLFAEKPGGASLIAFSGADVLNHMIQTALSCCEFEENFNYSGLKRSDWPAFLASGYKTIKRFEDDFICFSIHGVNQKNLFYEITSPEFGDFGLQLKVLVNTDSAAFGDAVHFITKKYLAFKAVVS